MSNNMSNIKFLNLDHPREVLQVTYNINSIL